MDHHCPWFGGCVGRYNQKHFYLFLFYAFISCLIITIYLIPFMFNTELKGFLFDKIIMVFIACISFAFTLGGMFSFHTYLILTNQTTLEFYGNKQDEMIARSHGEVYINPYDKGSKKNLEETFGIGQIKKFKFLLPSFSLAEENREEDSELFAISDYV